MQSNDVPRWRIWLHVVLVGGYFVPAIAFAQSRAHHANPHLATAAGLLLVCAVEIILFALVLALGCWAARFTRSELLLDWRPRHWVVPLGLGYSIGIRVALVMIVGVIISILTITGVASPADVQRFFSSNQPDVEKLVNVSKVQHDPAYFWVTVTLLSFVVAGLREEMWRAATLAGLRRLWPGLFDGTGGQIAGVALIAIVFGLAHLSLGLLPAAFACILGPLLGVIMVLHRSIWPAVFAHGFWDAGSFVALHWLKQLPGH